jgi:RNA polymerase sigma factor (sigma-70 family)
MAHVPYHTRNGKGPEAGSIPHFKQYRGRAGCDAGVLIKAVMNCNQLRDNRKIFQWLFTILRHEAYAHISKFSFQALISRARLLTVLIEPNTELGGRISSQDDMLVLNKALEELDEDSRKIVIMKSTTEDTLKTIALKLGMNYHTARSKYQRALHVLKKKLQEGERDD